jgi:hypothetical protein
MHDTNPDDDSDTWYCYASKQHGEPADPPSPPDGAGGVDGGGFYSDPPTEATIDGEGDLFADHGDNPRGLTKLTREFPNGRLVGPEPMDGPEGLDRNESGQFASRRRSPVPFVRDEDGTLASDPFAIGHFDAEVGDAG